MTQAAVSLRKASLGVSVLGLLDRALHANDCPELEESFASVAASVRFAIREIGGLWEWLVGATTFEASVPCLDTHRRPARRLQSLPALRAAPSGGRFARSGLDRPRRTGLPTATPHATNRWFRHRQLVCCARGCARPRDVAGLLGVAVERSPPRPHGILCAAAARVLRSGHSWVSIAKRG